MNSDRGTSRRFGLHSTLTLFITAAVLALGGALLVRAIPWVPLAPAEFVSNYGVVDNRRLLLRYAVFLIAAIAAPGILLLFRRRGIGGETPPAPAEIRPWGERVISPKSAMGLAAGLLLGFGFLFVGPGVAFHPLNGHELVHLGYLNEIEHGRLLNLDTRITYGPLLGYSIYGFMKLVSFSLFGFRLYWNVLTALTLAALLYGAGRHLESRVLWLFLGIYLCVFTTARYYLPSSDGSHPGLWGWANLARQGWAPLLLLVAAPRVLGSKGKRIRVGLGFVCGMGAAYAQETGLPALASVAVLCLAGGFGRARWRFLRDLGLLGLGALAAWALTLLPALLRGGLGDYLQATGEVSGLFLKGAGNLPYPEAFGRDREGHLAFGPYYLLPGGLLVALLLEMRVLFSGDRARGITAALALYGASSFVNVLVRADMLHFFNVAVAPLLLGFLTLERLFRKERKKDAALLKLSRLQLAASAVLVLPLLASDPGLGSLVAGAYGRAVHFIPQSPAGWEPIPTERGGIWTQPGDWFDSKDWGGRDEAGAIDLVRNLSRGKSTFIQGNKSSLLYFLGDAPAAVRFTDLSSQCLTPQAYGQLAQDLARNRPEFVFVMTSFVGARPGAANHYRSLGTHFGLEVYQREDLPVPENLPGHPVGQAPSGDR